MRRSSGTGALTVNYATPTGTATNGQDYAGVGTTGGSVSFADGETTKPITIAAVDDVLVEETESVVIALANSSSYTITGSSASIDIIDNDEDIKVVNESRNGDRVVVGKNPSTPITEIDDVSRYLASTAQGGQNGLKDIKISVRNDLLPADEIEVTVKRIAGTTGSAKLRYKGGPDSETVKLGNKKGDYTISIVGGDGSSDPRNMQVEVRVGNKIYDHWEFSVIYVAKLDAYYVNEKISDVFPATVKNSDGQVLGTELTKLSPTPNMGFYTSGSKVYANIAYRAQIGPLKIDPNDLNRNLSRKDSFNWTREIQSRMYLNGKIVNFSGKEFVSTRDGQDDASDSDEDLTADKDYSSDGLYVWVTDQPSISLDRAEFKAGDVVSLRYNFFEGLQYGGYSLLSSKQPQWSVNTTVKKKDNGDIELVNQYGANDNKISVNKLVRMTKDFEPSTVQNFTITGFEPVSAKIGDPKVQFKITGTSLDQANFGTVAYLTRGAVAFVPQGSPAGTVIMPEPHIMLTIEGVADGGGSITGSLVPTALGGDPANIRKGKYDLKVFIGDTQVTLKDAFELK